MQWVSPLESDGFTEYRDEAFLGRLGFPHLADHLLACWPQNGPCWDALAIVRRADEVGVLLVEAKSYPGEFFGCGCGAGARSRSRIEEALTGTKAWLGADAEADWLSDLYQFANRLAHVYLLRERLGGSLTFASPVILTPPQRWRIGKARFHLFIQDSV